MIIVRNFLSGVEEKPKSTIYVTGLNSTDTVYATSPSGKRVNAVWGQMKNPEFVLPSGMKQLEYIEGTGTQYIDTGVKLNSEYFRLAITHIGIVLTGANSSSATYNVATYANGKTSYRVYVGNSVKYVTGTETGTRTETDITVTSSDHVARLKENGQEVSTTTFTGNVNAFSSTQNYYIFARRDSGTVYCSAAKAYEVSIYLEPDVMSTHLIPCEYNGQVGMYDLVTNTFFGNSGTGSFIAGPEVPEYIDCFIFEVAELGNFVITTPTTTQNVLVDEVGEYLVEF